jgi:vitamin B12 transporter
MPALPIDTDQIVITAARVPEKESESAASVALLDSERIERLGDPLVPTLIRLTPSAAVTVQGGGGLLTEVRIRGAENNHTLLFIDGIRANDPATGNFARFELLNADLASRIEVVRGPQSALWGSEAIGGVIAINGLDEPAPARGAVEAGSFGFRRASASGGILTGSASLSGALGFQRARGIDSFSGDGDKDGYRNLSARLRGTMQVAPAIRFGASGFALTGRSEFDGYDDFTGERSDTLDYSRNRLTAGRVWAELGTTSDWSGRLGASMLVATNKYRRDESPINDNRGTRRTFDAQLVRPFTTGAFDHRLVVALDFERETFRARDVIYGGATDQDRTRRHESITAEWRGTIGAFSGDLAIRRDMFNRFKDAISLRASLLADVGGGFALAGYFAEGIAQPTFFDLYGFFPGNFVGNPDLKPESSRGFEGSLRFRRERIAASLTAYRQRLRDEIVENATFTSAINSESQSRRWGIEAEVAWQAHRALRLSANYAYLKATQPTGALNRQLEEWRRPRHSGSLAADGALGKWIYGGSIAYVGSHLDRQEVAPFAIVRLDDYWLAGARVAYAILPGIELFARGSNLLDQAYEDSAGYRTEGRGLFVGISFGADRRSSP